MSDQSDRKEKLDDNFRQVINLLNDAKLDYWLCHGSLLGVIRDQCLIPWDHDADIAMWAKPGLKDEITDLMLRNGFTIKSDSYDYDFQWFSKSGGREIDFNFYRIDERGEIAYSEWFIPKSKFASLLLALSNGKKYSGKHSSLIRLFSIISPAFKKMVGYMKSSNKFYKSAGYTTPVVLLREFILVGIDDLKVYVPLMSAEVLEYVYGKNWQTPQRNFDWTKDSPSTKISNSRFLSND